MNALDHVELVTKDASTRDAVALVAVFLYVVMNVKPHAVMHALLVRKSVTPNARTASVQKYVENCAHPAKSHASGDASTTNVRSCAANLVTDLYVMSLVTGN